MVGPIPGPAGASLGHRPLEAVAAEIERSSVTWWRVSGPASPISGHGAARDEPDICPPTSGRVRTFIAGLDAFISGDCGPIISPGRGGPVAERVRGAAMLARASRWSIACSRMPRAVAPAAWCGGVGVSRRRGAQGSVVRMTASRPRGEDDRRFLVPLPKEWRRRSRMEDVVPP